jgi:hypothetical protein
MKLTKYTTMAYSNINDEIVCAPCASKANEKLTQVSYTFNPENDAYDLFCANCGLQIHETL